MWTGMLPPLFSSPDPDRDLRAYVADYLKEEIAAGARQQNVPAFAEFLRVAALTSSELLNYTNVARETGVSAKVVRTYFEILEDTMLAHRIPPWAQSPDRRMIQTEKFYLFEVGISNYLARRRPQIGSADFGKSFEHWALMELMNYRRYRQPELDIRFWRTSAGHEVDFIPGDMVVAIKVKGAKRVHAGDLGGLTALRASHRVKRAVVVCLEKEPRGLESGIEIVPWRFFLDRLGGGDLVPAC